jgi:RNA polymerase sigma factor (sigma-70 family)
MSHEMKLRQMTIDDLAQRCAQETDLYFNYKEHDNSYCFELFRRAIQHNDERALEVVIVQYQPLVARWVDKWMGKHPDFPLIDAEAQDFIAQAFERFWISFTPVKLDKSESLAAVLSYLQMCVNGAIMDTWRKLRRRQFEQETREETEGPLETEPTPEDLLQKSEFWELIKKKSKDPREYAVAYASYSLDLSPREILVEYPDLFTDVNEVYKFKANFLDRLERDEEIREFARR